MRVRDIEGLKFPDVAVTRFFFKEKLHDHPGRVLELGCGNGNNLSLFREYGWSTFGIDYSASLIDAARRNFARMEPDSPFDFQVADLSRGLPDVDGVFDAVIIPQSIYYVPRAAALRALDGVNRLLVPGGIIFISIRGVDDYRYGRGREVESNGFLLDTPETGEAGLLNVFYHEHEVVSMLHRHIGVDPAALRIIYMSYDSLMGDVIVRADRHIVFWGRR